MGERGRSARDRLLARKIPPTEVTIRADFSPESDAAQAEVEAAQRALAEARERGADLTSAQLRLNVARDAMRPYVEVLHAVPLAPAEYEALIDAHPPREHEQARNAIWNADTFPPALLAACLLQDGEPVMSADEWAAWSKTPGAVASGEYATLVSICVQVNDRSPSVSTGKGPGQTIS